MTAHVSLLESGPESTVRCDDCGLTANYARTEPAQTAARDHNRLRHAYPEQTLDMTTPTEEQP